MRKLISTAALGTLLYLLISVPATAQPFERAVDYLEYIGKNNTSLSARYLAYLSAVSHGKSARKVEKRRTEVVSSIIDTRSSIRSMPPWNGDKSLRDTTVAYLDILYRVFNDDYGKIVNMEEIAEQSYDLMEAYMLAQQKAYEKLDEAAEKQKETEKDFAKKNNINLVEGSSQLGDKSKTASAVLKHCNDVYLVFFKPYKQEAYLVEAMNQKNVLAIEQNLGTLNKFADEGLEKLKTMNGYKGDASLITACRNVLNFYKSEATRGAAYTDFYLKEENFQKIKKQFESKPSGKRTQQDIDQYNKAVNDMNAAVKTFNETNNALNKERNAALNDWNKTYNDYMDEYMPKQAKQ